MVSEGRLWNEDRAQLVLVGAIAIGIVLIALTTVLNSAVFTENVAGGRSVEVTGDVTEFDREAVRNVRSLTVRINHGGEYHDGDSSDLSDHVGANVSSYSRVMAESYADTGSVYVNVTYEGTGRIGARLLQNEDANFSNNSGQSDWTPVSGASEIGWFVMNLDVENVSQSDPVNLTFTDTSGSQLNVSIRRTPGNELIVRSDIDGGNVSYEPCTPENGRVLLDVLGGSSYTGDCSFNSTEHLDSTYSSLKIEDGENGFGKYDLVVNDSSVVSGAPACPSGLQPCRAIAVWSIDISTHYRTGAVVYDKTHNVSVYGR